MKKIVFILSNGRSGSTLLDKSIGAHDNCFSLGEIVNFSDVLTKDKTMCGCGLYVKDCDFWNKVKEDYIKEFSTNNFNIKNNNPYNGFKKKIYAFLNVLGYCNSRDKAILNKTEWLYNYIIKVSQKHVLIDSSKSISRSMLLKSYLKDYEAYYIHLIRDGKAVLNSNKKESYSVVLPNGTKEIFKAQKEKVSVVERINRWVIYNNKVLKVLKLIPKNRKYIMHYEDFVNNPELHLKTIYSMLGIDSIDFVSNEIKNNHNHIIGGNSSRVNAKTIERQNGSSFSLLSKEEIALFNKIAGKTYKKFGY